MKKLEGQTAGIAAHVAVCLSGFSISFARGFSQMKKIAVSLVLAASLGLAACSGAEEATTEAADATAEATEATADAAVEGAEAATDAAAATGDAAAKAGEMADAAKEAAK